MSPVITHPMKRVTVVCEKLARGPVLALIESAGAHGWTLWEVEGSGRQGPRMADIPEFTNIQIEVVVPPAVAGELLGRLQQDCFPRYAMVAWESDIRVLRAEKF
jgi:nitrogen regulatory protein PII